MGFYIRDSIRVGPFRFNLSKSGVGVSVGVRGFRVGTGPRGNYVHMGAHGLYYRATLPSSGGSAGAPVPLAPGGGGLADDGLEEIESASVSAMRGSSSADLLREIEEKRRRTRLAPVLGFLGAIAAVGLAYIVPELRAELPPEWPSWVPFIAPAAVAIATAIGVGLAHRRDELAKTVVLFYELEPEAERAYQQLHDAFGDLVSCHSIWHVEAAGLTGDWKRSGGATTTVRRNRIGISRSAPPNLRTNIAVPTIPAGRETLYFFPDRVLVFAPSGVGCVDYDDLSVGLDTTRFVENGSVPGDSEVVGRTWQYVNKRGGPDRRFNNNREIPLVLYEELHLRSGSGLNELFQLSRRGAGEAFAHAVKELGQPQAELTRIEVPKSAPELAASAETDDAADSGPPRGIAPPDDLQLTGAWASVSDEDRFELEHRLRQTFRAPSPLANRAAQAIGCNGASGEVLYWIPGAASPLVVVHFNEPAGAGLPAYTYYGGASAWNKWAGGLSGGDAMPALDRRRETSKCV
jgi:hypothetical protein